MKLIDTDIAIDHFHGNQLAREFFAQTLELGEPLYISVVTLTELLAGMKITTFQLRSPALAPS